MRTFLILWFGQLVSIFGSSLTGFALGVWVYERTGSSTLFALIFFSNTLPRLVCLPFAGALVDRFNRRWLMIVSHVGSAVCSAALILLANLEDTWIGPIMVLVALSMAFATVQWPAITASTPLLVPKEQLGRAAGLSQGGPAAALILAPLLGGVLFHQIGLIGVLLIDLVTFAAAVLTLLAIRLPQPPNDQADTEKNGKGSLWQEAMIGWTYLRQDRGLWALLVLFASTNYALGTLQVVAGPLLLDMASPVVYGNIMAIWSVGGLVGSFGLAAWGGPRRKIRSIFGLLVFQGIILLLGGMRSNLWLLAAVGFLFLATQPLINGCSQVIWMRRVPLELQGRVFAFRRMVAWSSLPLAQLLAGPLTEFVFEPLLAVEGPLAGSLGQLIGVGPGRGIGLFMSLLGVLLLLTVGVGSRYRPLREVEVETREATPPHR